MKIKNFCKEEATKVLYKAKSDNTYHIDELRVFNDSPEKDEVKIFFCLECKGKIDINKYRLFNSLSGIKCFCLKE